VKLTLGDHLEGTSRAVTLAQSRAWDVIVLQDLSTAPTNFGERLVDEYAAGLKQFKELIKASSSDTKIVLFETWARQARHKLYKGDNAPFPGGPQEMQQIVTGNIKKSAQEIGATVAPIGQAFLLCGEVKPEIGIYLEDDYHANANGCYLAALVLFAHIFQADPRGLSAMYEIPDEVAEDLQKIAWQVVSASNSTTPASATSAQP
jgi:hypothetical protein